MKANKAPSWVGHPGGGRLIRSPARQDGLELGYCNSLFIRRGSSEGLWGPQQDQGQAGRRERRLPDVPSLPAGCLSAPITASTVSDPLLLIGYDTSEQFDLCLSNEVLKANLEPLLEQPLTVEYLWVMKKKLEQVMGDTGQESPCRHPPSPPLAQARSGMGKTCCGNRHRWPQGGRRPSGSVSAFFSFP